MRVNVDVNVDSMKKKLSQGNMKKGRYAAANQMLSDMNQFVPMKEGTLRLTGHVAMDGGTIIWNTPYAKAQYYGRVGRGGYPVVNYTTPGTGPKWDEKAKGFYMKDWTRAFVKGVGL